MLQVWSACFSSFELGSNVDPHLVDVIWVMTVMIHNGCIYVCIYIYIYLVTPRPPGAIQALGGGFIMLDN